MSKLHSYEDLQNRISYLENELAKVKSSNLSPKFDLEPHLFYEICENSKNAIAVFEAKNNGSKFIIKYLNFKAEEVESVQRNQIIGTDLTESFPSVKRTGFLKTLKSVYKNNKPEDFPAIRLSSGKIIEWKQNYIYKLTDLLLVSIYVDETEHKTREVELFEHREKLQIAMEAAKYYAYEINFKTDKITTDKELYLHLGYSHNESVELLKKAGSLIHPEDFKQARMLISKHSRNLKPSLITEFRIKNKAGQWIWFSANGKIIEYDKRSEPLRFVGLLKNIQNEKEVFLKLRESEEIFRQLSENIDDAFWLHTLDEKIIYANPACYKIVGTNIKEIFEDFDLYIQWVHPDDRKDILKKRKKNQVKQETIHFYEHRIINQDKEVRWLWIRTFPVYNSNGKLYRRAGIASDITAQKNLMNDLLVAKEKAEESDNLKSAFLANMSHEIRTPMNGIIGFAELLKDEDLTEEDKSHYLRIIDSNSKQLLNLINDIIDVAKIEAGQLTLKKTTAEINPMLHEVFQMFKEEQKRHKKEHLKFNLILPETNNNIIFTDVFRLKQILQNLLSNAFKFTETGTINFGYIPLSENGKSYYQFFVSDSGIGIPENMIHFIFERFGQVQPQRYKNKHGTGLGLAISKGLIELLGGKIWVESETYDPVNKKPGHSTFYFTVPINKLQSFNSASKMENTDKKEMKDLKNVSILIVEDDADNLEFLRRLILKFGAQVVIAKNGEDAIKAVETDDQIKLVLMDIRLPDIDGFETTQRIKEINPQLPVIAQTAYAMYNDREICLENGCDDYMAKPLNKDILFKKINHYIYN
ncbi:MAG: PAS domain-containing protein [Bacteroidetes bacterium]|nr:PAS domain-containing protein [Bacteroidota bacterium]